VLNENWKLLLQNCGMRFRVTALAERYTVRDCWVVSAYDELMAARYRLQCGMGLVYEPPELQCEGWTVCQRSDTIHLVQVLGG